ncbi:MAG: chromosome segregation protein SMC [Planctomycetaceae bacterium]
MLKSLELFGFKSFADRTTFDFAEGITCVVGPNGSGKSNVVDAIKWILGDQSAKSLRGQEMADVIFNGSAGRKPSGFAEATLTFDNAQGLLPLDAAEVQIGRRLYTGGDSEYLLNRTAVRLKDIREIFMGTGAGTAAYSIIEQGRVDQILQANPTARRMVFEEAAGISRYKARKVEAQRRLERVDQNLLRLRDIVDELEARLNATRSQASKAAKYRELSGELRELWTGLAADDYRRDDAELAESLGESEFLQQRLDAADARLAELDRAFGELDAAATDREKQLRQIERRRSSGREEMARYESTIRHHGPQLAEFAEQIERLRHQRQVLRHQSQSLDHDLQESTRRLDRFQAEFVEQQERLELRERRMRELRDRLQEAVHSIDGQLADRDAQLEERSRLLREQAALESRREASAANDRELTERCQSLATILAESRAELGGRKQALQEAQRVVAEAQRRIDEARDERRMLRGAHSEADGRLADWREQRSAKLARRQLLEDLDARQEGLNLGVRSMLRRAAKSSAPPWNLILGNVGDLLQAELDDAPLLEVALGTRVQLLVIQNLDPLVEFVNSAVTEVAGRVGFVELSPQRQAQLAAQEASGQENGDAPALAGEPGVVCRADALVSQSAVPELAAHLLADTWIVETLDDALRFSAGKGRGCRLVTRQGELIDAGGALFVGHTANEATVISRKSELRQLRVELQELDRKIAAEQQRLDVLDESLLVSDSDLQALQAALNERMELLAVRKSEHASQAAECGRVHAEIDAALAQQQQLTSLRHDIDAERTELQSQLIAQELKIEHLTRLIEERQEIAQSVQDQLQRLQHEMNAEQLQLAKHEERLSALQAAHMRLLEDQRQRRGQSLQADARLADATDKYRETSMELLRSRAAAAELYLADQSRADECRAGQQQLDECRAARKQMQQQQDALRDERRRLNDGVHGLQMRCRDLRHQMSSLAERIREEFQLELADLVAAGVTAKRPAQPRGQDAAAPDGCELVPDQDIEELTGVDADITSAAQETRDAPLAAELHSIDEEQSRAEIEARVERLRRKIKALGSINADSLQDLDELEARYTELAEQLEDLEQAKTALEDIIRRINLESKRLFLETFEAIRVHFQELYRKLFGGGEGNMILEDPDDVLECGIDIVARPPGKELRSISLLSGGEKTMTAVALLFAMFKSKPSPYCILDEVDAALDEANVDRYVNLVKEFRDSTQFVIITHRKRTMTAADRLYGVTMEQAGVSKRLTVQFEDVSENGHFRTGNAAA